MPIWELNTLLEQVNKYLPHILYGSAAIEAERNAPKSVNDPAQLPGMVMQGGV